MHKILYLKYGNACEELKLLTNVPKNISCGGPYYFIGTFLKLNNGKNCDIISLSNKFNNLLKKMK